MRLFLALPISAELREYAHDLQQRLRDHGIRGKYVKASSIHLTVQFIGEVAPAQLGTLCGQLAKVVPSVPAFQLELAGIGGFGRPPRHLHLRWEAAGFAPLVQQVRAAVAASGLSVEADAHEPVPHATLVRFRGRQESCRLRNLVDVRSQPWQWQIPLPPPPPAALAATSLFLMQSFLAPKGPTYTELERFKLA